MEPIDLARKIVDVIVDKKGEDIVLLDLRDLSTLTDYFVICSGASERQLGALLAAVREMTKKSLGVLPLNIEGDPSAGWILMDYGSVVVHLFAPELRVYYDLEGLWRDGRIVVRIQ
ncbi:MAG TPA: ribosome silencing factor [Chloroflexi bacterium]|nr:ribosome silencing factor [Chloroflexota bacterium]